MAVSFLQPQCTIHPCNYFTGLSGCSACWSVSSCASLCHPGASNPETPGAVVPTDRKPAAHPSTLRYHGIISFHTFWLRTCCSGLSNLHWLCSTPHNYSHLSQIYRIAALKCGVHVVHRHRSSSSLSCPLAICCRGLHPFFQVGLSLVRQLSILPT